MKSNEEILNKKKKPRMLHWALERQVQCNKSTCKLFNAFYKKSSKNLWKSILWINHAWISAGFFLLQNKLLLIPSSYEPSEVPIVYCHNSKFLQWWFSFQCQMYLEKLFPKMKIFKLIFKWRSSHASTNEDTDFLIKNTGIVRVNIFHWGQ